MKPSEWPEETQRPHSIRVTLHTSGETEWIWRRVSEQLNLSGDGREVRVFGPVMLTDRAAQELRLTMAERIAEIRRLGTAVVSIEVVEIGDGF